MAMKDLTVGVVGRGVVGGATAEAYSGHVKQVLVHDVKPERANCSLRTLLQHSDLVFVCLPTPQREGRLECDTSAVDDFFTAQWDSYRVNFVLRSTVPIGTTRRLWEYGFRNLVHSPEFLTARTAQEDADNPTRNVIGLPQKEGEQIGLCSVTLRELYKERWPCVPIFWTSSDESEAVKLAQNAFSAVKIAWFNELHQLCQERELSFEVVRAALLAGGWINEMHTQVPGPDGKMGYGGACLSKDMANWIGCFAGECPVSRGAMERNLKDRTNTCP